jgi:soluble lytic murein transglycosylase
MEVRLDRKRGTMRRTLAVVIPAAVLAVGVFVGNLRSMEWRWSAPLLSEVQELAELAPIRALPRTEAAIALFEARQYLSLGRPWAAWESLRGHVDAPGPVGTSAAMLAAQAAAEWGGWREARAVLVDRPWLEQYSRGEGLLLLARAEEELGNGAAAIRAYRRYVAVPGAPEAPLARARLAGLLRERGEAEEAARQFGAAAADLPGIADWLRVLEVQQLAAAGDPSVQVVATRLAGGSAPVRLVRVQTEARGWVTAAQTERAIERLDWEARILSAEGARHEAALLRLDRGRLLIGSTDPTEGRAVLREIAAAENVSADVRREAAQLLGGQAGLTADEELARAAAYEASARPGLAARALRAALAAGAPDDATQRLRLAQLLYDERDFGPARVAFQRAAEMLSDTEQKANAELHAARSLFRSGGAGRARQTNQQNALSEFRRVVDRYPGTPAAGTALFLLGDEAATNEAGISFYRRAAAVTSSPDAREALYRVGDRSLRLNDTAGAIRAWEEYVGRFPRGEQTAQVAYRVGKLHESAGRRADARTMYRAAMAADPVSYYAVRAGERLGENPLDAVLAEPRPWVGLASDPADAAAVLARLDQLEALGLSTEWDAEYQAALRRFESRPYATLRLAEGLRDRNRPVEGIRVGRRLLQERDGEWDERLLRLVFPFPYRELIVAESRRYDVDPILYAALVRQESSFRYDARSWVGATGLGQIMPATGRWLAPMIGIREYDEALLLVPEVNLRMGTRYLADLLRRYNGSWDLALAGYNAGPSRADRWRRELDYGRDIDDFRERIPFDETRHYVMIVQRNAAIYERLYGNPASPGGTSRGD